MTNDVKPAPDRIKQNIAQYGFSHVHRYRRWGPALWVHNRVSDSLGAEFVLAGAYFYKLDDVPKIIGSMVAELKVPGALETRKIDVERLGVFSLRKVHMNWAAMLIQGALDFCHVTEIQAFQIVPDRAHWTLDIPDMSEPWSPVTAPAWRWLREEWTYPVPSKSVAITNLGVLRGERITEAMRWEEDEWEIFAGIGPDVPAGERRVVPLGILLAADESLLPVVNLTIGTGLWRDAASEWHPWGSSGEVDRISNP
jgi:hypothetical protein